ncbi:NfeD family protein [Ferroplasma sp.]|uniref:NfeD family protein n=1 Tax=Ferroplasma sp. TaxID=2591003 RepID=UPI00307DB528
MGDVIVIGYILDTIVSFFIGAWFARFWIRHPFRRQPATGKTSMIGKTGEIKSSLKNNYYEIAVDSQIWRAVPDDPKETFTKGEIAYVKSVRDITLYISKIK